MEKTVVRKIRLVDPKRVRDLFGIHDEHLRKLESIFGVRLALEDGELEVLGDPGPVASVERLLTGLQAVMAEGFEFTSHDLQVIARAYQQDARTDLKDLFACHIRTGGKRRCVVPKSVGQRKYIEAIRRRDIVVGIGPAGTGKTYLAVALAVEGLLQKAYSRIVLTRPAVEAGERLGFLPGDIAEKIHPFLRPLYDALNELMDSEKVQQLIERGNIEIAPLAYMRGRTLNDSFIIMDEAQNSTPEQMKMFLTRLGFGSKSVITGDITQVDLSSEKGSGLIQIQAVLEDVRDIDFVYFTERDVVRHPLVLEIIKAYERYGQRKSRESAEGSGERQREKDGQGQR
ncbi:MAG: PhoH family protein [Candidatus Tectomicrobia bacterium]|nr:PhoH family protein [Candidatus Tectomicrobia bacterium]